MDVDADEDEEEIVDEDNSEGFIPPTSEPSRAKRLKNNMKALFCMQAKGKYKPHVASKESRRRDNKIMSLFREDVSGGSEERITPKTEWMAKQGFKWTDSEEDNEKTVPAAKSDEERATDYSA